MVVVRGGKVSCSASCQNKIFEVSFTQKTE